MGGLQPICTLNAVVFNLAGKWNYFQNCLRLISFLLLEGLYFAAPPYLLIFTPVKSYENKLTHNSLLMTEIEECRKQSLK